LFWILKSYALSLFAGILGTPKGFHPTPKERERIEQTMDSLFPIHPRKRWLRRPASRAGGRFRRWWD
jgi:hypothetical protein